MQTFSKKPLTMKAFEFNTISYSGRDKANEDYILCHKLSANSLIAILADGMGGLSHGAEAARIVSESILTTITVIDKIQKCSPEDMLRLAFDVADAAIQKKCRDLKCKMGAALTVALIIDSSLYYAWQGNVRLYKVGNGKLLLLTTDHIASGTEGIFLTRCINGKGYRESIPVMHEELDEVDRILICSDGCYQYMNLTELTRHNIIPSAENMSDDCSLIEINFV